MSVRRFGRLDRRDIAEVTIEGGEIEARIVEWGAILRDLVVPGRAGRRSVVLGLDSLDDYLAHSPNFGAVIGRFANRIGGARFRLGGREVVLDANENGAALHGGRGGFGRRAWTLIGHDRSHAHLGLVSDDGDMGFPGRLHAVASYEIVPPATLRITLQAFADATTPVNLTTHSYFNLDGSPDVRDHHLTVASDHVLRTDAGLIPTGETDAVASGPLDFGRPRRIRFSGPPIDLDHSYVLRRGASAGSELAFAAALSSPAAGIAMEIWTSEPTLQVYDGYKVDVRAAGLGGARYGRNAGIALEPQRFPDAPNHAHFPSCTISPGQLSRQVSELRFSRLPG